MNREFETGAVRDSAEGKGRFDCVDLNALSLVDEVLKNLANIQFVLQKGDIYCAMRTIKTTIESIVITEGYNAILLLGKVSEKGAKKYGEGNWQKGIPASCYIDSTIRHWCKYKQNWQDENHLGSTVWNLMGLYWTLDNVPNTNDLEKKQ